MIKLTATSLMEVTCGWHEKWATQIGKLPMQLVEWFTII